MIYRDLGSQGPKVSAVGFGLWAAGSDLWGQVDEDQVMAAMVEAEGLGVNWFDTAERYSAGRSEELLGRALKGRRERSMIFTKVAGLDLDPRRIRQACEASLRRLRTDWIDLYQIHWYDPDQELERCWEAMANLVEAQLVRYLGVSNFEVAQIETCEAIRHVDSVQPQYSMLWRQPEEELLEYCDRAGTGVIGYGPLAYGLLTGKYGRGAKFGADDWRSGELGAGFYDSFFAPDKFSGHLDVVEQLQPIARQAGVTMAQLAIAWVLRRREVSGAICGVKTVGQAAENAQAGSLELSAWWDQVDQILNPAGQGA